jgi:hypothetical protein
MNPNIPVQLLEVGVDKPLFCDLEILVIYTTALDEVPLALKRTVVDLFDDLDGQGGGGSLRRCFAGRNGALFGIVCPSHEDSELGLVGQGAVLVWLNVGATKDGRHFHSTTRKVVGDCWRLND